MKNVTVAVVLALAGAANAAVFSNGPFTTGVGNGFGGANTSAIETGYNNFGYGHGTGNLAVADDFTVTDAGGWDLSSLTVYAYQTQTNGNSNQISTITSIQVGIFSSNPNGTMNAPNFGDHTTNQTITTNVFSGTYRVQSTTLTNSARAIMAVTADMAGMPNLGPGTYWIAWSLSGSVASGPWAVPVTPARATDNAQQRNVSAVPTVWGTIDGGSAAGIQPQDMAFDLGYEVVPAPGAFALVGLGGLMAMRRRR